MNYKNLALALALASATAGAKVSVSVGAIGGYSKQRKIKMATPVALKNKAASTVTKTLTKTVTAPILAQGTEALKETVPVTVPATGNGTVTLDLKGQYNYNPTLNGDFGSTGTIYVEATFGLSSAVAAELQPKGGGAAFGTATINTFSINTESGQAGTPLALDLAAQLPKATVSVNYIGATANDDEVHITAGAPIVTKETFTSTTPGSITVSKKVVDSVEIDYTKEQAGEVEVTYQGQEAIGTTGVTQTFDATKSRSGVFGAVLGEVNFETSKKLGFGITFGSIFQGFSPKGTNLNTNEGIMHAGTEHEQATNNGTVKYKSKGLAFVGPHFNINFKKNWTLQTGVTATFAGYKMNVKSAGNTTEAGEEVPATNFSKKTSTLGTMGAMPFAKLKYNFKGVEVMGFVGYNLSRSANLKNYEKGNTVDPIASNPNALLASSLYNATTKAKVGGLFAGAGLSIKLSK